MTQGKRFANDVRKLCWELPFSFCVCVCVVSDTEKVEAGAAARYVCDNLLSLSQYRKLAVSCRAQKQKCKMSFLW